MNYSKNTEDVLKEFDSGQQGLNSEQVLANREKYGENKLYEKKKKSIF